MKKEIKIIYSPDSSSDEKGKFFEDLNRHIFETQRFNITQRVNFTGMEIDLIAKHRDRKETAYIECKARDKLESKNIQTFTFQTQHKEADSGYFLSTIEFEHQVAGLIEEMRDRPKYSHLYFWGPSKIFELLEASKKIEPLDTNKIESSLNKLILAYTYFGTFYICILSDSTMPTHFCVYDAKKGSQIQDDENIEKLKNEIPEINDLMLYSDSSSDIKAQTEEVRDTIAEVKESEEWYDYRPASSKHFIGRQDIRKRMWDFLSKVQTKTTCLRIFYITGRSGWGKSSLITDLRGKSRNKRNRNRFFVFAVDTRSASSDSFVASSFDRLIENAKKDGFIRTDLFVPQKIKIISNYDILSSDSVKHLLEKLEGEDKTLVLIFDQFEDVFRKPGLFKAFYKFLLDVNEVNSNLVLGFSWKSEINIPIEHEAYHLWQQVKEYAYEISVPEFGYLETHGIIRQLEKSIKRPINIDLKRRLIESSQGFPWLIKKLCIHTYNQLKAGKTMENLVEEDLNCKALFQSDLDGLNADEIKALKYIANRSYEGNFFDATEIDEKLQDTIIRKLIDKRLIIRSGSKYDVYWDTFREFLRTNEIPPIGESYIIRQPVGACLRVFNLFKERARLNLDEMKNLHPKHPDRRTIDNVLRELRSLGLVSKEGDYFQISSSSITRDEKGFKDSISRKFSRYTLYLKLCEIDKKEIRISDIISVLKRVFKGYRFSETTWRSYANILIGWFEFAGMDIVKKFVVDSRTRTGRAKQLTNPETFTPQCIPEVDIQVFLKIRDNAEENLKDYDKIYKSLYDLSALNLVQYYNKTASLTEFGKSILKTDGTKEFEKSIAAEALKTRKIKETANFITNHPNCSLKEFRNSLPGLTSNIKSRVYKNQTNRILYAWAKFVCQNL